ncbi:hypothetical protein N9154_02850 [Akkermansiaceae bacterium]|nr:hypothetical protein [Akkermansiaceae bacterium]
MTTSDRPRPLSSKTQDTQEMAARAVRKLTESGSPFTLEEAVDDYLARFVANQAKTSVTISTVRVA